TEKWYRETNDYLVRVNQLCSNAQRADKEILLNEVQSRIHTSQLDQDERLKRLISLGQQLYQGRVPANAERVIQETRTVLETLQLLVAQLRKQSMQASLRHFQQPEILQSAVKSQSFASQSTFEKSFSSIQEIKSTFSSSQEKSTKSFTSVQKQTLSYRDFEQQISLPVRHVPSVHPIQTDDSNYVSKTPLESGRHAAVASSPSLMSTETAASSKSQTFPIKRNASTAVRGFQADRRAGPVSSSSYPFFVVPLEDLETPELRRITLRCIVQAFPAPKVRA
ncbi:hypothetical protein BIW11_11912, partial [Tropilaelaps mercedesae]